LTSSVVLVSLDSSLDALIVEVGVVLLLESLENTLQLLHAVLQVISLLNDIMQSCAKLTDTRLGQTE
jgi:hypothetical protein